MAGRGDTTREHLLDVAEQLFGERGVDNVSLREIRIAAGARNTAAMQFHFGGREGVIEALAQRHVPRIGARQQGLWQLVEDDDALDDSRRLVEVLVLPGAEYLLQGPSARAWTKVMAELVTSPDMPLDVMAALAPPASRSAGRALRAQMRNTMSERIANERLFVNARTLVHQYGDRAVIENEPLEKRRHLPSGVWVQNLVDMVLGALFAPVGSRTEVPRVTHKSR